jgi:hypothetical protein
MRALDRAWPVEIVRPRRGRWALPLFCSSIALVLGTTVPAASGPAPTSYLLHVTSAFVGDFATTGRSLSGTVGPGAYTLSVEALNACGASDSTVSQTVVVP